MRNRSEWIYEQVRASDWFCLAHSYVNLNYVVRFFLQREESGTKLVVVTHGETQVDRFHWLWYQPLATALGFSREHIDTELRRASVLSLLTFIDRCRRDNLQTASAE